MGMLQRFEDRLEQLVSGAFAKAFRSAVQPVEIAAALQREVDNSAQILSRDRRLVPNRFHVELSPADHGRLAPYSSTLAEELTEMLRDHASDQAYVFPGPVSIDFDEREDLTTGRFRVRSSAEARVTPSRDRARQEPPADTRSDLAASARVRRARAVLEVNGVRHLLEPPGLVVGRGSDADLRINDPGISRRHVELRVEEQRVGGRDTGVSAVDLGSTNGMLVNGSRLQEAALQDGDTIRIGTTTMTVRLDAGASQEPRRPDAAHPSGWGGGGV